jgi:hypothetical protein
MSASRAPFHHRARPVLFLHRRDDGLGAARLIDGVGRGGQARAGRGPARPGLGDGGLGRPHSRMLVDAGQCDPVRRLNPLFRFDG